MLITSLLLTPCYAHNHAENHAESSSTSTAEPPMAAKQTTHLMAEEHWHNVYSYGEATFSDNEIALTSTGNWFYTTKKTYSDFIFEAEILMPDVSEYSNSGFIFRAHIRNKAKNKNVTTPATATTKIEQEVYGYQAEVDPSNRKWSGGLYDQGGRQWLHPIHKDRSAPDADFQENYLGDWTDEMSNAYKHLAWNKYKIVCQGSDIKIYLNNVLTTHVRDVKESEGYIGIQHHGSAELATTKQTKNIVRFRNIQITEL